MYVVFDFIDVRCGLTVRHKKLLFRELFYYYEIVLEKEQSFYKISSGRFALRQRSSERACPQFSS